MNDKFYWAVEKAGLRTEKAAEAEVLSFETSAIREPCNTWLTV